MYELGREKKTCAWETCPSKFLKPFLVLSVQGLETRAFTRNNTCAPATSHVTRSSWCHPPLYLHTESDQRPEVEEA